MSNPRSCRQLQLLQCARSDCCRLVWKLCQQLNQQRIYDVGMLAPPRLHSFLEKCGFGPDDYDSVAMLLPDTLSAREPYVT